MSLKVASQGLDGSYTSGSVRLLHPEAEIIHCETFSQTFDMLQAGEVQRIVIAAANSNIGWTRGYVEWTRARNLHTVYADREIVREVSHALVAPEGVKFEDITEVWSQAEAHDQCGNFYGMYPHLDRIDKDDTALAAKEVLASGRRDVAAIASADTIVAYPGLYAIKRGIQDDKLNLTRFLSLVRREDVALPNIASPQRPDTTIGVLQLPEYTGSLADAANVFKAHDIGLSSIYSRHIPNTPLNVEMIMTMKVGLQDPRLLQVARKLLAMNVGFQHIGSYKADPKDFDCVHDFAKQKAKQANAPDADAALERLAQEILLMSHAE